MQVSHAATPTAIGIDFVGNAAAMGATESAGVVAKTNWNSVTGASRVTPLTLKDETGAATSATITFTSDNAWSTPITDQAGNRRLMKGYLDNGFENPTTVTVAGLPVAAYDIYVYVDGDNAAVTRTGAYQISGTGITTATINLTDSANANFNGVFTQGDNSSGNYVKFSVNAGGFTLTATPGTSTGSRRAPVNALQIVPAGPPPPPPPPPSPDFTIAATPASRTITQGTATSYTVNVGALNGFSGGVSLSVSGLPANTTASFTPASVPGAGSATLDVTTTANTPVGSSTLTITGTSGSLTHSATVSLVVNAPAPPPDFTIAATPASQTTTQGSGATYTVTVGAMNGFSGAVALSAAGLPANAIASFTPASIAGSGSATLNVTTAASTPTGTSTLTVTGTSGSLTHSATVSLTVNAASTGTGTAISVDFVGNGTAMGAAESAGVVPKTNWNSATGAARTTALALKDETGAASSATITWTSDNMWSTPITDQAGNQRLMKGYLDNGSSGPITITVAGLASGAYDVYVYADGDNSSATRTGGYRISGTGITTTTINLTDQINTNFAGTFTQANNSTGNYVKFTGIAPGSGGFTLTATPGSSSNGIVRAPVNAIQIVPSGPPPPPTPDFTVAATPASRTVTQGTATSYTVSIGALNGFTGTVALSASGLPANATASFTPASVAGSGSATLDVATAATTPGGSFTLTIMGTSGSLSHAATVALVVAAQTFSISGGITPAATGASSRVDLGGTATATTTADASGNYTFTGVVNGSYAVMPSKPGITFTPTSRNVTVSGANVTAVDFTAAQSPNTVSITSPADGATISSAFTINATASSGVVGVQFRVDGNAAGPEDTAAPYSVSLTAPGGPHVLTASGRDAAGNVVTSAPVNVTVNAAAGTALTVNGAQTFQKIDGLGVNMNSLSWKNGQLQPAIDMLVNQMGVTVWRVVFDMEDWESSNDNADPNTPNWTFYNSIYSNAKFQNLWGTLRYLNQKGITTGILLSFMGRVPPWMGGSVINTASEDEWVEMMATLCFYAKNTENVQFDMLDPINEPDWDGIEGPQVDQFQYTRLLQKLSVKLDAMGLSSLKFVGPNTAQITTGVNTYMPQMMSNSIVMSKVDHFGFHNYGTNNGGADAAIKGSAFPNKNYWITEVWNPSDVLGQIGLGTGATMVWDALDSVYNHAILAGRGTTPPNDNGPGLPPLAYNTTTGVYTPRDTFYQHAQIQKYVPRGSMRIAATESNGNLTMYAFRDPVSGRLTLVGRNIGASSITVNGSLSNVPAVSSFQFYRTDVSGNQFTRGSDVVVTNGSFVFTAPVNSYFTLTAGGTP